MASADRGLLVAGMLLAGLLVSACEPRVPAVGRS